MHQPNALKNVAAMRGLLHGAHAEPEEHHQDGGPTSTLVLRGVAMLVIFLGGLAGAVAPLLGRWVAGNPDNTVARLVRSFSGGTILALALIHIIPEGLEQLSGESLGLDYPLGGIPVALGLLSMVLVDYLASYLMSSRQVRRAAAASAGAAANAHARPSGKGSSGGGGAVALPPCCDSAASGDAEQGGFVALPSGDAAAAVPAAAAAAAPMTGASTFLAHSHHHHHLPTCEITSIRRCVAAYTMELGCVFHSVIIGVSIGVVTSSPRLLVVMTAVMIAHQLLEGLALGTMLAAATLLAGWKKALMAAAYALCMPLGIAIGIGVADSYAPDSLASLATQGTLNAFSGGMLLAVSMFSLVGEEFSKSDLLARPGLAAALAAAVLAGVGGMAVIGIWG